jgi:phosphatidylethanolamine/phosphatidyl-N-methylethanolamine N-methyltransferase
MREQVLFLSKFLRRPVRTGAVAPSCPELGRLITDRIGLEEARLAVELGPGTGALTQSITHRAAPEARLLAVEIDPVFAQIVQERFPRVTVVNGPAQQLPDYVAGVPVDCIVSGLPWAGFSDDLQTSILGAVLAVLKPGGWFTTFAYVHAAWLPPGRRFRRRLQDGFTKVERTRVIWRNLPPAFVYRCQK